MSNLLSCNMVISPPPFKLLGREINHPFLFLFLTRSGLIMVIRVIVGRQGPDILVFNILASDLTKTSRIFLS